MVPVKSNVVRWESLLIEEAVKALADHRPWVERLQANETAKHLAVLVEPYLQYIIDGKKTIESRFSTRRCAPYGQVNEGDLLLLKRSGGPVVGLCEVSRVWYYALERTSWQDIRRDFAKALCAQDPAFWNDRASDSFATLMQIRYVTPLSPLKCSKQDRRGWVVLNRGSQ